MANATMHPRNAINAKMAECYIKIGEQTYNFMSAINVEVNFEKNKTEVAILGRPNKGHKTVSSTITGSAEFHYNTSIMRELAQKFQNTGEDTYFDMVIINNDPTSNVGRQTITLYDCNADGITLAAFDADNDDYLTETMDFTVERFEIGESFQTMDGMIM